MKKTYDDYIKLAEEELVKLYGDDMVNLINAKKDIHSVAQTLINLDLKNNIESLIENMKTNKPEKEVEVEKAPVKPANNRTTKK